MMGDWGGKTSYLAFPIIPIFQYSNIPFSKGPQLARADLDPQSLAGGRNLHFLQAPLLS
jgi:hypothetical protein